MMTMVVPIWGVLGVLALLANAIVRLTPRAVEALQSSEFAALHVAFAIGWTGWMIYAEGYRGFQGSFAPRVAARALDLGRETASRGGWLSAILAPAYAMGLFRAQKRTMIVAWTVLIMVICLILAVSQLAQPWRGLVDLGVVAGLAYGALSIVWFCVRALRDPEGMETWLSLPG